MLLRSLFVLLLKVSFFAAWLGIGNASSSAGDQQADFARWFQGEPQPVDYSMIDPDAGSPGTRDGSEATGNGDKDLSGDSNTGRRRVAILGNTLVHRAADFGYLELEFARLFSKEDLVFRNLGWPGDTVTGSARVEFGPGEEETSVWERPDRKATAYGFTKIMRSLKRVQPHVLFIAYGSNAVFADEGGLVEFRAGLEKLLDVLQPTGVRVVLLSPPPRETVFDVAGAFAEQNLKLQRIAKVIKEVAAQRGACFVDLYGSWPDDSANLSANLGPATRYTENGLQLNEVGYQWLARTVVASLFPHRDVPGLVHMNAGGDVVAESGADASTATRTQYGMRWKVVADHLPPLGGTSHTLRIDGLSPGTYLLDVDGQRNKQATAEQWARGVSIRSGPDFARSEDLRQSIIEKNRLDFFRRRPLNKTYIYLFRSHERGHHRAEVERFGLHVREAQQQIARLRTAPPRFFELVRARDLDSHHLPEEAIEPDTEAETAAFTVPDGFEIKVFAADPLISKPIDINWDEQGRMWVATSTVYPHLPPGQVPHDQIVILEDTDRDGRADKSTVFADDLFVPHSVIPGHGGAYVTQSTDLLFLRDTDGDGKADQRRVVLTGFGNADAHHMIHRLRWGPGGDLYFMQSLYVNSHVETPWGVRSCDGSCIWRLRPDTMELEVFSTGLVNPWGIAFDTWGQLFASDGAGAGGLSYIFPGAAYLTNSYADREVKGLNLNRPKECGLEMLSGRHLPPEWRNTFMSNNFRANRTSRYRLNYQQGNYSSEFLGDMVRSDHQGFRPVEVKMGPDGAIYIVDWYNLIIGHGEVDFHHPLRDKQHGRIWRLTAKDSPLVQPPPLVDAAPRELLDALQVPEQWTRDQARRQLREREPDAVLAALREWTDARLQDRQQARADAELGPEHGLLEALWVYQGLRQPNSKLIERCLTSADGRVRAAAVRVLSDWHTEIDDTAAKLTRAVTDPNAQVRLEAVNALRRLGTREAVAIALRALDYPLDQFLEFALFRTVHERVDQWLTNSQAGEDLFDGKPERAAFAFTSVGGQIATGPLAALLGDGQLKDEQKLSALNILATFGNAAQHEAVLNHLPRLSADAVTSVLQALLAGGRQEVPDNASSVCPLFESKNSEIRGLALELAGRWRIHAAIPALSQIATTPTTPREERLAAGHALIAVNLDEGSTILHQIYEQASTDDIRASAIAALAGGSVARAIPHAVRLLAEPIQPELASFVADAILTRQDSHEVLVAELRGTRIPNPIARLLLDRVRLSGQEMPELVSEIRRSGELKALVGITPTEVSQMIHDVSRQGDLRRGREIFQRKNLNCAGCHAIAGSKGGIGPDLSSIGASARVAEILQSLLNPSASIKQGYGTVLVMTVEGRVLAGILLQQTRTVVRIQAADGKVITIPTEDVEGIVPSDTSMMPAGIAENLTREEIVDLVRYLSSLGRH